MVELLFCTNCGKQIDIGANFCSGCGKKVVNSSDNESNEDIINENRILKIEGVVAPLGKNGHVFDLMYKLYHEQIDPLVEAYGKALNNDIKAIGSIKLGAIKATINIKDKSVDKTPFATHLRVIINEYRDEHEYETPDMVIYDIRETFETIGKKILYQAFREETWIDLHDRMKQFEQQYLKWNYKDYLGTETYEEYAKCYGWDDFEDLNEYIYIYYRDKRFWDVFSEEENRFGNMDPFSVKNKQEIIHEAEKEIIWRQEYLKNPNAFLHSIKELCEKTILDLIFLNLQALQLDFDCGFKKKLKQNESINSSTDTIDLDKINRGSDDNITEKCLRAQEILDYSKSGAFKADGCEKSFRMLCTCLNTNETVATILGHLNTLSQNHSECATQMVNKDLLDKITNSVSRYFEPDEKSLFYKDSALIFYGKDGILITNKAIYRLKKAGVRKLLFSKLETINLLDLLKSKDSCIWCFNHIRELDLDCMGVDAEQAGIIMALICLLFNEINSDEKIKFYNYI